MINKNMKQTRGYMINGTHHRTLKTVTEEFKMDKDTILERCISFEWPGWEAAGYPKGKGRYTINGRNFVSLTSACRYFNVENGIGANRVANHRYTEWVDNHEKRNTIDLGIRNVIRRKAKIVPRDVYNRLMKLSKDARHKLLEGKGTTLPSIRHQLDVLDGLTPSRKVFTFEDLINGDNQDSK